VNSIEKVTLKNGGTRYKTRIRVGGKRRELSFEKKGDLEDELQRLREQEKRRKLGIPEPQGQITYAELIDKVLAQYPHRPQSKQTLTENLNRSRTKFGTTLVRELRSESIGTWLASLDVAATTKRNSLKAMRQVLTQGIEWHYLTTNAARAVTMPPLKGDAIRPFESWAEVQSVADAIGAPGTTLRALILFACATGMRQQEWQPLRWSDVDTKHRQVTVRRTMQAGEVTERIAKTRSSLRVVLLQQRALDALGELPTPLNRAQLVFPDADGGTISLAAFRGREKKPGPWRKALTAAGVEYREPRQMRHSYASLSLAAGAKIEDVSRQMGHSDIKTTLEHYARFLPQADDRYLAVLDAFAAESEADGRKTDGNRAAQ
jgi:integrase